MVGICGASGAILALKFLSTVLKLDSIIPYVVISKGAKRVLKIENGIDIDAVLKLDLTSTSSRLVETYLQNLIANKAKLNIFEDYNLDAPIASGSFLVDGMIILPCSMNTLAKIACGISDSLITRSFLVNLKERRNIVVAPREMPLNSIILSNMKKLSDAGVTISPPMFGYYANIKTLEDMENFLLGKYLDSFGIYNQLYKRWGS